MSLEDNSAVKETDEGYILTEDTTLSLGFKDELSKTLDGNGYKIDIQKSRRYIFYNVTGKLKNTTIVSDVQIARQNEGVIENCTVSNVTHTYESDTNGCICNENHGVIKNCMVEGEVEGEKSIGLIAAENHGEIKSCTTEGSLLSNSISGGICGVQEEGIIKECDSSATVKSIEIGGGICGQQKDIDEDIVFDQCSFTGEVQGEKESGIIIGSDEQYSTNITCKNCSSNCLIGVYNQEVFYPDLVNCNFSFELYSSRNSTSIFESDMKVEDSEFDISLLNRFPEFCIDYRGTLVEFTETKVAIELLTETDTEVDVLSELNIPEALVDEDELTISISKKERINKNVQKVYTEEDLFNCNRYDTIELQDNISITKDRVVFSFLLADFNGNGYTIRNLKQPLIRRVCNGSIVSDLTINDSFVKNQFERRATGILVRTNVGSLSNITVKRSMIFDTGSHMVGGIVGRCVGEKKGGELLDCSVEDVTVKATQGCGSIAGKVFDYQDLTVENCSINGGHSGGAYCSGLRADEGEIQHKENITVRDSEISGTKVGGVFVTDNINNLKGLQVENTQITGIDKVGGVGASSHADSIKNVIVDNCTVKGRSNIGGLLGKTQDMQSKIQNCKINAEITGDKVAGFIGNAKNVQISDCVTVGRLEGTTCAGFLYDCENVEIENSYCDNVAASEEKTGLFAISVKDSDINAFTLSESINANSTEVMHNIDQTDISLLWSSLLNPESDQSVGTPIESEHIEEFKTLLI